MQIKVIPASQFENQLRVNGLKTRREVNQETIEKLRAKMAKLKLEIQDYEAANREATVEIDGLESQINAAVAQLAAQEQGDQCEVCGAAPYTVEHHGDHYCGACWAKRQEG